MLELVFAVMAFVIVILGIILVEYGLWILVILLAFIMVRRLYNDYQNNKKEK